jgi:hypothetical protein
MAQTLDSSPHRYPGIAACAYVDFGDAPVSERFAFGETFKQVALSFAIAKIGAEFFFQDRIEHDSAILITLAVAYPEQIALKIDVLCCKMAELGNAQPAAISEAVGQGEPIDRTCPGSSKVQTHLSPVGGTRFRLPLRRCRRLASVFTAITGTEAAFSWVDSGIQSTGAANGAMIWRCNKIDNGAILRKLIRQRSGCPLWNS